MTVRPGMYDETVVGRFLVQEADRVVLSLGSTSREGAMFEVDLIQPHNLTVQTRSGPNGSDV